MDHIQSLQNQGHRIPANSLRRNIQGKFLIDWYAHGMNIDLQTFCQFVMTICLLFFSNRWSCSDYRSDYRSKGNTGVQWFQYFPSILSMLNCRSPIIFKYLEQLACRTIGCLYFSSILNNLPCRTTGLQLLSNVLNKLPCRTIGLQCFSNILNIYPYSQPPNMTTSAFYIFWKYRTLGVCVSLVSWTFRSCWSKIMFMF